MDVSIIICTYNRSYAINDCLDSMTKAMAFVKGLDIELVVVNNNSTDDTGAVLLEWQNNNSDVDIKIVTEDKSGLSYARNCGIKNSTGELVIFTDDDCRMKEDYIEIAFSYYKNDKTPVFRGGRVELGDPEDLPVSIKTGTEVVEYSREKRSARHYNISAILIGANMAIPRCIINKIGAFDVRFGAGTQLFGGEEVDYFYRAYIAGYPIQFVPNLVIIHFHGRKETIEAFNLSKNYLIGTGALYTKYIFKHAHFCRPLWWDLKKLFKEIISGENLYMPEMNFSYKHLFVYIIKGSVVYLKDILLRR